MDKLQQKIRQIEEEHAEEFLAEHLNAHEQKRRDTALKLLGGIRVTDRIAQALSGETMRALIRFQEEKEYEVFGFDNFAAFLNESEHAPMTKNQFYDRKAVLEKEGDFVFDLLNGLGMPIQKRKLLGKGNIALDGEMLIVKDDDGNETEIELNDKARLLETLTALADTSAQNRRKLEREKEKTQKLEGRLEEAKAENDRILAYKKADFTDLHATALMNLVAAFKTLEHQAEQLSIVERSKFAPRVFETIAAQLDALSVAYDRIPDKRKKFAAPGDDIPALNLDNPIKSKTNDEELADLMD